MKSSNSICSSLPPQVARSRAASDYFGNLMKLTVRQAHSPHAVTDHTCRAEKVRRFLIFSCALFFLFLTFFHHSSLLLFSVCAAKCNTECIKKVHIYCMIHLVLFLYRTVSFLFYFLFGHHSEKHLYAFVTAFRRRGRTCPFLKATKKDQVLLQ